MEINNKTTIIISCIVIFMTLLGYICGVMSHNVTIFRDAQAECYKWLETECPCIFPEDIVVPFINISGGENVQNQTNN